MYAHSSTEGGVIKYKRLCVKSLVFYFVGKRNSAVRLFPLTLTDHIIHRSVCIYQLLENKMVSASITAET